jgi:hypothetical protein
MEMSDSGFIFFGLKILWKVICVGVLIYLIFFRRRKDNLTDNTESYMNEQKSENVKSPSGGIFSFVLSGIPLVIYPFVFIASVMGLAGYRTPGPLKLSEIMAYMFYILTIVYPVVYIVSYLLYFKENKRMVVFIPYIYLLICIILFNIAK